MIDMQGVFQLVTIYKYVLLFSQYICSTVQITISYHEIKTHSFLLFLIKLHSDLKAHIYRQENSAQQANMLK